MKYNIALLDLDQILQIIFIIFIVQENIIIRYSSSIWC